MSHYRIKQLVTSDPLIFTFCDPTCKVSVTVVSDKDHFNFFVNFLYNIYIFFLIPYLWDPSSDHVISKIMLIMMNSTIKRLVFTEIRHTEYAV